MANIEYLKYKDGADFYGILLTFCGLICMIAAVLGIKFKWFKHRLNFESLNELNPTNATNTNTTRPETFRSINPQFKPTPYEVGVFRKKSNDEFDFERPKDLPPIKINNSSTKVSREANKHKLHFSSSASQKQATTTERSRSGAENSFAHSNKSNIGSISKSNRSRSRSPEKNPDRGRPKSPKKDHRQVRQTSNNTRNYERNPPNKTIFTLENSKLETKQENSSQQFPNTQQMEKKKNNKKKIKFENIPIQKDDPNSPQIIHRRPTGFTKLSQKELEELEALSEQTTESQITTMKRRPTGFEFLSKEELEELEDLANKEENNIEKKFNSIQFHNIEENEPISAKTKNEFSGDREDKYGFINNERNVHPKNKDDLNTYPEVIEQNNGQLTFKITGFSDNEDDDQDLYSKLKIKTKYEEILANDVTENYKPFTNSKPEPQPRTTLRQSREETTNIIAAKIDVLSISQSLIKETSNDAAGTDNLIKTEIEEDSWSAVRNYRNITEEMAKHNQAIRDAAKEKAARRELRNPLAYDDIAKPKNMKDVKRKQHETEERDKKTNHKVNLNNDNDEGSEISC